MTLLSGGASGPKPRLYHPRGQAGGRPQLELTQAGPDAPAGLRAAEQGQRGEGAKAPWRQPWEATSPVNERGAEEGGGRW